MALSGVEIFKHLPKTNCKKCGHPTCLAFAMKLAAKQASLDACPDASEDAKKLLGAAAAPPIRAITLGTGDKAVKVGDEICLFRHEKKFFNPSVFAVAIKDTEAGDAAAKKIEAVKTSEIDRVGQKLRVEAIAVIETAGDPAKFAGVVKQVVDGAPGVPIILVSKNPAVIEAGISHCADKKPLIYAATAENAEAMAKIAKEKKASLVVAADGLDALAELSEKVKGLGVEDLVLDSGARKAKDMIEQYTIIRRAAIKKGFKPLGYPIISFVGRDDALSEAAAAAVGVMKYASIIILNNVEKWKMLALLSLRQNIYTDPQVPMQVAQNVYKVGDAKESSPLMITTNFSLSYFIVRGEVENSKVPSWLAVMDNEGLSVLTAWAAGKFTASKIAQFITESGVEKNISHKELIIPGYVAILSGSLEEKLPGWKITVGPREANGLPTFLKARA
ncbi:MAG: acetyl-CoA decarbonylase/synthase complex subunit gamma [Nitrospirae bacterium GWC2_57_13]|jgi:acetyl-CoA decarbonylase/synthase, CODH/ACS complex subunit gamma|nr:MAG: acetyl-CoA decarbonylase/synthase complex subunit gamma [Nitrospirae bacterium GWC1_57_7]OGW28785.1 MAG: acetyl-CoA decarbonylase/synthase complex subunit gamma [Nitrospirae bacterium GWC2_57_13]HAR45582.1 acetyl-CoA decarbonylase/synthase complex subunit gamma [Nitrospiraceae bacterium]